MSTSKIPENASSPEGLVWEQGWDDHRRKQMQRLAALSFSEKLAWLEEAHRLVMSLQPRPHNEGKIVNVAGMPRDREG